MTQGNPSVEMESRPAKPHPGEKKLAWILAMVVAGFFASLIFHYELGVVLHMPYPLNTFLFRPHAQFTDFYDNFRVAKTTFAKDASDRVLTPGWGSTVLMLRAWLLYRICDPANVPPEARTLHAIVAASPFLAWGISEMFFLFAVFYFVRGTILEVSPDCLWAKILALTLCSYPVLFCLDRSNFETTVFVLLAASIFLYGKGRFLWSALLLGVVVAVKPYGVVFLALFLGDRKFKEIAISLGTAVLLTLGALLLLPGEASENLAMLRDSMAVYTTLYVQGNEGLYFGSSLYGLAKVWIYSTHFLLRGADAAAIAAFMRRFMSIYFLFAVAFFAAVAVLLCGFRMAFWKKIALLVCCMNMLPYICGDYRLIHLFIPMLLFLCEKQTEEGDKIFCALFGLLLIPKGFMHLVFDPVFAINPYEVSEGVVFNPLLMLALVLLIAFSVLRRPFASDTATWLLGFAGRSRGLEAPR